MLLHFCLPLNAIYIKLKFAMSDGVVWAGKCFCCLLISQKSKIRINNWSVHQNLAVPFFADHIWTHPEFQLWSMFDIMLTDLVNLLAWKLIRCAYYRFEVTNNPAKGTWSSGTVEAAFEYTNTIHTQWLNSVNFLCCNVNARVQTGMLHLCQSWRPEVKVIPFNYRGLWAAKSQTFWIWP
jgi:hypothetical protein